MALAKGTLGGQRLVLLRLQELVYLPMYPFLLALSYVEPFVSSWVTLEMFNGVAIGGVALVSLTVTYLAIVASQYISQLLSVSLNWLTWKQIRRVGWGSDTVGEVSISADSSCAWLLLKWLPLPNQLAKEIVIHSNKAASLALDKFRGLVTELALSKEKEMKSFFFSEYLTWDELIHTSYFSVPRFRMLVAYAIAHSKGFRPSEAFKSHPDYNLVAGWYEEIKPKAESARA